MRVSIFGSLPSGEEWSVNPVYKIGGDFGVSVSNEQAQTIATAIAAVAIPAGFQGCMSSSTYVLGARVEARSLSGTLETQAEALKGSPTNGTSSQGHSYQTSWVISLRTTTPGASGRGRLYWPATGQVLDVATLRPSSTAVNGFLTGAQTYLSALDAAIEATLTGVSLVVWSRVTASTANVNRLQVGNVLDVQRRRRDALIENYSTVAFP
jgi:hypothetical protein